MFCANCDNEIEPENSLCPLCGFDLTHIIALLNESDDDCADIEDEVRAPGEIAKRALSLAAVISCAYGDSKKDVVAWLKKENLWDAVSPSEKEFLENETTKEQNAKFTWRIEALVPLLWSINKIGKMPGIKSECNTEPLKKAVIWPPNSTKEYIASSKIRAEDELFEEYEKVYQAHWKVRDAQLNNKPVPGKYNPEVVYERHYGFNWLTGYMGQDWDDITTDT
ncbi:MAG TPA: DUF4272 domain-containing protein [candidate division Zixibacteria bacterium]|nr:DUF4272 domain-containing protein [candidate division Zixibacteria bacterium]